MSVFTTATASLSKLYEKKSPLEQTQKPDEMLRIYVVEGRR